MRSGELTPSTDVVIADARQRQALVAIRALGRSGLACWAVDSECDSPAFSSKWLCSSQVVPDFTRDPQGYVGAVVELCRRRAPRSLIPCHDGSIEALRPRRSEVERVVGLALSAEPALDVAVDKTKTLALAEALGIRVPRGTVLTRSAQVAAAVDEIGLPAVVKPARWWLQPPGYLGSRVTSVAAYEREAIIRASEAMLSRGIVPILQEWLPGSREAVSLFYARGTIWARFAQRADRTLPPLGGNSVFRESVALPPDIATASERLVREMKLEGYSEVEFRRDGGGRPVLMEVNPRCRPRSRLRSGPA